MQRDGAKVSHLDVVLRGQELSPGILQISPRNGFTGRPAHARKAGWSAGPTCGLQDDPKEVEVGFQPAALPPTSFLSQSSLFRSTVSLGYIKTWVAWYVLRSYAETRKPGF